MNNLNEKKINNVNAVENFCNIQKEGLNLFIKKNHDYGDSYKDYGLIGVLVRLGDKIKRLQSITNKGINLVNNETLRDTLIDLQNYSTLAIMLFDEDNSSNNIVISEAGVGNIYK